MLGTFTKPLLLFSLANFACEFQDFFGASFVPLLAWSGLDNFRCARRASLYDNTQRRRVPAAGQHEKSWCLRLCLGRGEAVLFCAVLLIPSSLPVTNVNVLALGRKRLPSKHHQHRRHRMQQSIKSKRGAFVATTTKAFSSSVMTSKNPII